MRLARTLPFLLLLALAGCGGGAAYNAERSASAPASAPNSTTAQRAAGGTASESKADADGVMQNASLQQADASQAPPVPVERKIIRDATLTVEVDEPSKALPRLASLAESRGGFVVNTESRQQTGEDGGRSYETITVQMRVPAAQFDAALAEIRAAGRVTSEKISGKDVTEEYIDLEARLRTQRALEAQLLEIMKQAHSVSDAMAVQRGLADVRTEIERVEGRRRFIENQASLSTINVTLTPPAPLVSTTGFFRSLAAAFGQGLDIAAAVTLFLIKAVLALLPVALIIGVPAYFILRFLVRRLRRNAVAPPQPAQPPQPPMPSPYEEPPPPMPPAP
ncbi:MAG TPA: DUF4349 domain-containing protein [Pyrinomonadaceae bacterium]|nr:DUF4349 domain-containing protein [Pyrinomonadaceae bacterium]